LGYKDVFGFLHICFWGVQKFFDQTIAIFPDDGSFFFYLHGTSFKLSCGRRQNFSVGRSLDDYDDDDDDGGGGENSLVCCAQDFGTVLNGCNKVLILKYSRGTQLR